MAALSSKSFKFLFKMCNSHNSWLLKAASPKFYSVFPPTCKEPVFQKPEIETLLQENSKEQLMAVRVKPPANSQTCSVFYDPDVEMFINYILRKGKRDVARSVMNEALTKVKHLQLRKYHKETDPEKRKDILLNPVDVFKLALKNVTPLLWYLKIKRSGTWYKVPVGITEEKAKGKAMKWLLEVSNEKDAKVPLKVQLALEIIDAANYEGKAVAKKIEMHKLCEGNRGYVNYWWT